MLNVTDESAKLMNCVDSITGLSQLIKLYRYENETDGALISVLTCIENSLNGIADRLYDIKGSLEDKDMELYRREQAA